MKIAVFTNIYNVAKILPYFLDYYIHFVGVDKIFLYDDNSSDETYNIIKRYEKYNIVNVINTDNPKYDERNLMIIRNEEWKKYRNDFDWIIIVDVDEFLYHPYLKNILTSFKNKGITIHKTLCYDMISNDDIVYDGGLIIDKIKTGFKHPHDGGNKSVIFNPKKIIDVNYTPGGHICYPYGDVNYTNGYHLYLLHYKFLSLNYILNKSNEFLNRYGEHSKKVGSGDHNINLSKFNQDDFNNLIKKSYDVFKEINNDLNPIIETKIKRNILIKSEDINIKFVNNQLNITCVKNINDNITLIIKKNTYKPEILNIISDFNNDITIDVDSNIKNVIIDFCYGNECIFSKNIIQEIKNEELKYNYINDSNFNVNLNDQKIYLTSNIKLDNIDISIKNIDDEILYRNLFNITPNINYWIQPNDKSYLNGFKFIISKNNNVINEQIIKFP